MAARDTQGYHHYDELKELLKNMTTLYSDWAKAFVIGKSVRQRDLVGLRITNHATLSSHPRPQFKWVGNMHGDETVGREMLVRFIQDFLEGAHNNNTLQLSMLDEIDMWVLPSMNPDGE